MEQEQMVRIGIDKDGILIIAGDPEYAKTDKEYINIVKNGGTVKNISLSEYRKMKLYEKVED